MNLINLHIFIRLALFYTRTYKYWRITLSTLSILLIVINGILMKQGILPSYCGFANFLFMGTWILSLVFIKSAFGDTFEHGI